MSLVSEHKSEAIEYLNKSVNCIWKRKAQVISFIIQNRMKKEGLTKRDFANLCCFEQCKADKILKGHLNLTIEDIEIIESCINVKII